MVLSTDRYLSETTLLRRQTVELVFDSREGIRVPTESIRVVEQTVTDPETEEESQVLTTGVFVLVGQQAEFKPVTVVEQMEEFALVVPADGVSDSEAPAGRRSDHPLLGGAHRRSRDSGFLIGSYSHVPCREYCQSQRKLARRRREAGRDPSEIALWPPPRCRPRTPSARPSPQASPSAARTGCRR